MKDRPLGCAVIGGGAWGTAIADRLVRNGHRVMLWAREDDVVEAVKAEVVVEIKDQTVNQLFIQTLRNAQRRNKV